MKKTENLDEIVGRIREITKAEGIVSVWYSGDEWHSAKNLAQIFAQAWIPVLLAPPSANLDGNRGNTLRTLVVNLRKNDLAFFVYGQSDITSLLEIIPSDLKNDIILVCDTQVEGFKSCSLNFLKDFAEENFGKKYHKQLSCHPVWYYRMIRNEVPYRRMMQAVVKELPPIASAVDLGCGVGLCMRPLKDMGIKVKGIDCSAAVLKKIVKDMSDLIEYGDLGAPLSFGKKYDLAVCVEVAEHLRQESATILIDNIDKTGAKFLLFSAAAPGQGGTGHVNEREREYWEQLLNEKSFRCDDKITKKVVNAISEYKDLVPWLIDNVVVYTR